MQIRMGVLSRGLPRALFALLLLGAAAYIGVYLVLALLRLRYPLELEWMEGGSVDHVRWILAGNKLYGAPSLAFTPFVYAPLYFYTAVALAKLLGVSLFTLRLLSFVASAGTLALLYRFAHRETGSRAAGLLAAGTYAACYRQALAFYDLARVDSLFVLFLFAALYVLRHAGSRRAHLAASVLLLAAFLTKQSTLVALPPLLWFAWWRRRQSALAFAIAAPLLCGAAVLVLDLLHGRWFTYYAFWLPSHHSLVHPRFLDFWIEDLMASLGVACVVTLLFFLLPAPGGGDDADERIVGRWFALAALTGTLAVAYAGRLHVNGWANSLMPAFAALSLTLALGFQALSARVAGLTPVLAYRLNLALSIAGLIQLLCLGYNPAKLLPTAQDEAAGRELLAMIAKTPGDVFIPAHGYISTLAGKRTFAHEMAMVDVLGPGGPPAAGLMAELRRALGDQRFGAVITDTDFLRGEIDLGYERTTELFQGRDVFWPLTGARARPQSYWTPRHP